MVYCEEIDRYFVHIPKNAGTAFIKQYCNSQFSGHQPVSKYPSNLWKKTFAFCRNPYDRLVSIYEYARMDKNYWHSSDGNATKGKNQLYDIASKVSFREFVSLVCNGFISSEHTIPQTYYISVNSKVVVPTIIKIEELNNGLSKLFKRQVNLIKENQSNRDKNLEDYYDEDTKELVYKFYENDFKIFKYDK